MVVIEDDHHISDLVAMYLRPRRVPGPAGGRRRGRARADAAGSSPRLVIVDIGLPGRARRLRGCRRPAGAGRSTVHPVIILTARDDEVDRILGLELGADDYVTKPFSARELVARVHAILRRTAPGPPSRRPWWCTVGSRGRHRRDGRSEARRRPVALTTREFDLLAYLVANQRPGPLTPPAPRRGLGRRLVRRRAHRRRPRPPAPQEARRRPSAGHRVGRRLPPRIGRSRCAPVDRGDPAPGHRHAGPRQRREPLPHPASVPGDRRAAALLPGSRPGRTARSTRGLAEPADPLPSSSSACDTLHVRRAVRRGTFASGLPPPLSGQDLQPRPMRRWPLGGRSGRPTWSTSSSRCSSRPPPRRPASCLRSPTRTRRSWWRPGPSAPPTGGLGYFVLVGLVALASPRWSPTGWPAGSPGR